MRWGLCGTDRLGTAFQLLPQRNVNSVAIVGIAIVIVRMNAISVRAIRFL